MDDPALDPQLLECLADAAYCVDKTRRILMWNSAAERLTGYSAAEAVGSHCWNNLLRHVDEAGRELCRGWCPLVGAMQDGMPREARVSLHHREGHRVPVQVSVRVLRSADGAIIGGIETFRLADAPVPVPRVDPAGPDERVSCPAGMVPPGAMQESIERWLEAMRRGGRSFGAIRLRLDPRERGGADLDPATCAAIIKALGATISHTLRPGELAARSGEQEYLVLLPAAGTEDVAAHARWLGLLVAQTFLGKDRRPVHVRAQIGAALGAADDTAADLLARAALPDCAGT